MSLGTCIGIDRAALTRDSSLTTLDRIGNSFEKIQVDDAAFGVYHHVHFRFGLFPPQRKPEDASDEFVRLPFDYL